MDELTELTDGKDVNQLYHQLAHQLNNGEPIGGSICSHIMEVLTRIHTSRLLKRHWHSVGNKPKINNIDILLYFGNGLVVSGKYIDNSFRQLGNLQSDSSGTILKPTHWTELIWFDDKQL